MVFLLGLFFILGSAVGSFLNVVIDRTMRGESIVFGRSYCEHCRATLGTMDLIPIVSFAGLRARCRYCKHKLSLQYPLVETITGILFVLTFYFLTTGGSTSFLLLAYQLVIISVLIVVAVVDYKFSLIPTAFVFAAALLALFKNYFYLSSADFISSVLVAFALAFSFLGIVVATRGRGMGSGDIPLVFLLGLFLGWPYSLLAIFLAFLLGATVSIVLLFFRKKTFGQTVPFAPFLILGSIIVLYWGNQIMNWYLSIL